MINEGNSLAELQAKVLLASRHEKKSVSLWTERLGRLRFDPRDFLVEIPVPTMGRIPTRNLSTWMSDKLDAWAYVMRMNKPPPTRSSLKVSPRATSVAGWRLAGRRADMIIIDDMT